MKVIDKLKSMDTDQFAGWVTSVVEASVLGALHGANIPVSSDYLKERSEGSKKLAIQILEEEWDDEDW